MDWDLDSTAGSTLAEGEDLLKLLEWVEAAADEWHEDVEAYCWEGMESLLLAADGTSGSGEHVPGGGAGQVGGRGGYQKPEVTDQKRLLQTPFFVAGCNGGLLRPGGGCWCRSEWRGAGWWVC